MVFYKVLTNQFPYDVKTSILETLRNIHETEPTRPSRIIPRLSSDIEAIVLKALAKNPSDREQFQNLASTFEGSFREDRAANFLEDPRPLPKKLDGLKASLEQTEPCFIRFVIAEHYLKDGDRQKAIRATESV